MMSMAAEQYSRCPGCQAEHHDHTATRQLVCVLPVPPGAWPSDQPRNTGTLLSMILAYTLLASSYLQSFCHRFYSSKFLLLLCRAVHDVTYWLVTYWRDRCNTNMFMLLQSLSTGVKKTVINRSLATDAAQSPIGLHLFMSLLQWIYLFSGKIG